MKSVLQIKFKGLMLLFFLIAVAYEPGHAQQLCVPKIKPVKNDVIAYKVRENDKRCEGFYEEKVAAEEDFEVVGLVKGDFYFKSDKKEVIRISSPFIRKQAVYVTALPFYNTVHYRMDTVILPEKTFVRLPVGDVIYGSKIGNGDICLFGWIREENQEIYVPVCAVSEMEGSANKEDIILMLRASTDVTNVRYQCAEMVNGKCTGKLHKGRLPRKIYRIGTPIRISLPQSKSGKLWIEVSGMKRNTDYELKKSLRVATKEME